MILENKTTFEDNEIFQLAKRENNQLRNFLLVNLLQAKHVPVSPSKTLSFFQQLGQLTATRCGEDRVLVIGFAETATAIGFAVAKELQNCVAYLHTTRESLPENWKIVDFNEEHSHATEQMLYCKNKEQVFQSISRIVFVEDEVSTGKTIWNFVKALQEKTFIPPHIKISVSTLINGLPSNHILLEKGIAVDYLVKVDKTEFETHACEPRCFIEDTPSPKNTNNFFAMELSGMKNPRLGVPVVAYQEACEALAKQVAEKTSCGGKKVLVLGTEEFMYPALVLGSFLEKNCQPKEVKVQATTRSPILPSTDPDYPLHSRIGIHSLYEKERKTYLYNLENYDLVLLVTDTPIEDAAFFQEICNGLAAFETENTIVIRWVN